MSKSKPADTAKWPRSFNSCSPEYVSYCIAHGYETPAQQRKADLEKHGSVGFPVMKWLDGYQSAWEKRHSRPIRSDMDQLAFQMWLASEVVAQHVKD
jgi:hypothetical protein